MSFEETLKLVYNLIYYSSGAASKLSGCIRPISTTLTSIKLSSPPLQPPVTSLVNALCNLDLALGNEVDTSTSEALFPAQDGSKLADRLLHILEKSVTPKSDEERDLDATLSPLVNLIRKLYTAAPEHVQEHMRSVLLPQQSSRDKPLGQDSTLASRLLRLSISPLNPLLRDSISTLLFELSDKDPTLFVQNIGYGYAAGFLTSNGMAVPPSVSGSGHVAAGVDDINPITGQRRDAEPEVELPEMTDEEKEREAERLFVLFERLRATGVVDVKNPVQQAIDEGRFEELD